MDADDSIWVRLAFGAAGIAFIAYYVYLGQLPPFVGLTGALIYLGVFAAIAQLAGLLLCFLPSRHPPHSDT
jgi:hypothetical protein